MLRHQLAVCEVYVFLTYPWMSKCKDNWVMINHHPIILFGIT